jgi:hypothetical protein
VNGTSSHAPRRQQRYSFIFYFHKLMSGQKFPLSDPFPLMRPIRRAEMRNRSQFLSGQMATGRGVFATGICFSTVAFKDFAPTS